jgi:hypothetical protein
MVTTPPLYDGTITDVHERVMGPGDPRRAHIENPDRPGWSLCLTRLNGRRTQGTDCPDCAQWANANRTWIAR